ncbi:OCIA domain-containing protein 1-like [Musca vetustissima]|uniref:OCIA domain-containing protein 1-like n=1 Tax=Musca vetustissima TaxID=27455 RepID=UPI002AB70D1E|nr:OCIA domain-containing protein 1-like [Musca vetustissima]
MKPQEPQITQETPVQQNLNTTESTKEDCRGGCQHWRRPHFTSEELRVLHECNQESFYQRALPLGLTFGGAAYLGVKNGLLKPNAKYGAIPKVVLGVIMGYFVGKWSYKQKCAEKLMALPDSKIGEMIKQRKEQQHSWYFTPAVMCPKPFVMY